MKPSARPRLDEGHDSDTSAAPLAQTPPMPKPEEDAQDGKLRQGVGEAAEEREDRIERDAQHQRARAAEAIGNPPESDPADGGGDEHDRSEDAALRPWSARDRR